MRVAEVFTPVTTGAPAADGRDWGHHGHDHDDRHRRHHRHGHYDRHHGWHWDD